MSKKNLNKVKIEVTDNSSITNAENTSGAETSASEILIDLIKDEPIIKVDDNINETIVKTEEILISSNELIIDNDINEWKIAFGLRGTSGKLYKAFWKEEAGKLIITK